MSVGLTPMKLHQLLSESEYIKAQEDYGEDAFTAGIGAEAVREDQGLRAVTGHAHVIGAPGAALLADGEDRYLRDTTAQRSSQGHRAINGEAVPTGAAGAPFMRERAFTARTPW